jgi:carotenoid cleavage dioxygenase-like enzyme
MMEKGTLNGNCNRTDCQKPPATYYNHSTQAYYCKDCAMMINKVNCTDALRMFGHDLCTPVEDGRYFASSIWWANITFLEKGEVILKYLRPQFIEFPRIDKLSSEQIYTIYNKKYLQK